MPSARATRQNRRAASGGGLSDGAVKKGKGGKGAKVDQHTPEGIKNLKGTLDADMTEEELKEHMQDVRRNMSGNFENIAAGDQQGAHFRNQNDKGENMEEETDLDPTEESVDEAEEDADEKVSLLSSAEGGEKR